MNRRTPNQPRWLRPVGCAISLLLCLATIGFAQQTPELGEVKPKGIRPNGDDEAVLIDRNGQIVRLPLTATLEKVLQALKQERGNGADAAERKYSVSRVSLDGTVEANEEFVTLSANVSILVIADNADVLVPLRLNEATLIKVEHSGPNEAGFDKFDNDQGNRWWLRGKGEHELKLTLSVPVRKQGATRRVLLSLPDSPVSVITLAVPLPRVSAKVPERSEVRVRAIENGRSEIKAYGFDRLLDLTWQGVTDDSAAKPELQVNTFLSAELRAESLVLEGTQLVRAIQGTFDKLIVRLPPEFGLLDVSGSELKEHSVMSGSPSRVQIVLKAPTSGPVKLEWVLEATLPVDAKRLPAIDGFEVEEARKQSGFVAMTGWEGVNLRKLDGEDRFLHRASQAELQGVAVPGFPPAGGQGNVTVYRFMKQPFRLVMEAQKIEPYFSVEPLHVIRLQPGHAELESTLRLQVHRGSLQEVTLPWPAMKSEAWDSVTSDTPDLVEDVRLDELPTGAVLRIRLLDRKTRGDKEFEIRLKSKRAIAVDGSEFGISLPAVTASGQRTSTVVIVPADNLSVDWSAREGVAARPTPPDADVLEQLSLPANVMAWRWDAGSPVFAVKAQVQQQTIKTESVSELTLDARTIGVSQRISYDVAFEGLSQVLVLVPRGVADRVRFQWRDSAGTSHPLTPVFTGVEIEQSRQYRLHFEAPQLGKLDVIAQFDVDRPEDGMTDAPPPVVPIPVLQSSDAEFSTTRVRWRTGEKLTASVNDPVWKPELDKDKTAVWSATGAKSSIGVTVRAVGDAALQDFTVERALIRSVIQDGRTHSQMLLQLDREVRELTLILPPEIAPRDVRVWWNQKRVEPAERMTATGDVELRLKLGRVPKDRAADEAVSSRAELWLDFHSQKPTNFHWSNRHELVIPRFTPNVWVAQTMWEIVLPADQHLLTLPRDYAAQFQWQRALLMWYRQPNFGYDRIERLLTNSAPEEAKPNGLESGVGNTYPVSCFGPAQPLAFRSMSGSAVVGCGAGFALLLGFVLIRMPATRHVLTFLVVGFLLALASLWFSEPVHVLLQPAIFGTAMAVVAAMIDRAGRRSPVPLVTLSSPSDFYARGSSIVSASGAMVNPEAPTAAPVLSSEPISASGSRGRE